MLWIGSNDPQLSGPRNRIRRRPVGIALTRDANDMGRELTMDVWSRWMQHDRFGGDELLARRGMERLTAIRERILEQVGDLRGAAVLDVGAGDGLVGFGALEHVEDDGRVIFADISSELLAEARSVAETHGVAQRCEFVVADAASLAGVESESVDVVTLRSVLIYVDDKAAAFQAFNRVLRPGGRISLFEPINQVWVTLNRDRFYGLDVGPVAELVEQVWGVYDRHAQPAMMGFDEMDLVRLAHGAGFDSISMHFEVANSTGQLGPMDWEAFLSLRPNPLAPSVGEAIDQALSGPERNRLSRHLRPSVEAGSKTRHWHAGAFLAATKPLSTPAPV